MIQTKWFLVRVRRCEMSSSSRLVYPFLIHLSHSTLLSERVIYPPLTSHTNKCSFFISASIFSFPISCPGIQARVTLECSGALSEHVQSRTSFNVISMESSSFSSACFVGENEFLTISSLDRVRLISVFGRCSFIVAPWFVFEVSVC